MAKPDYIAHFGTFDVDNYGDLLFPQIAEWRLAAYDVHHFSPTTRRPCFVDAAPAEVLHDAPVASAVIVGGGNIVHFRRSSIAEYRQVSRLAYPLLTLGAAELADRSDAPLLFNGPSISDPNLSGLERGLLGRVLQKASYVAFRDEASVALAKDVLKGTGEVHLVPDTAYDISRMWPAQPDSPAAPYIVFHVNSRYGGGAEDAAAAIANIAAIRDRDAVMLPIGPCHGDVPYAGKVAAGIPARVRIEEQFGLRHFAGLIANADMYIGSSMHGFITAVSYGKPAVLVLDKPVKAKFLGALLAAGLSEEAIIPTWTGVAAADLDALPQVTPEKLARLFAALDAHWQRVHEVMSVGAGTVRGRAMVGWRLQAPIVQVVSSVMRRL